MNSFDLIALEKVREEIGREPHYIIGNPIFPDGKKKQCIVDVLTFNCKSDSIFVVEEIKGEVKIVKLQRQQVSCYLGSDWEEKLKKSHE